MNNIPIIIEAKDILINFMKNDLLKWNKFLLVKKINNIIALNHEDIVVAIGIIIKPIFLKKYTLIMMFKITAVKEI